jgi:sporadic carbohydrate cluster protein (TIGR04323 family)
MTKTNALRGYISSRPFLGERVPQHVQNLAIRDYCRRIGMSYLLSATEYAMPGCFMILEQVLNDLTKGDGVATYSLFMLPEDRLQRLYIYQSVINAGASLHAVVEGLSLIDKKDIGRIEDIWQVRQIMNSCPSAAEINGQAR